MLVPLAIGALVVGAWWRKRNVNPLTVQQGAMTPARKLVYTNALNTEKDSTKLRTLADEFEKAGLNAEATLLRKRANMRDLPPAQKAARKVAFKKGMASQDPDKVLALAKAFNEEGATGAAMSLQRYARGLATARAAEANAQGSKDEMIAAHVEPEPVNDSNSGAQAGAVATNHVLDEHELQGAPA